MNKKSPLVVAIILNWNGIAIKYLDRPILTWTLSTLKSTHYDNLKIIVVDANSSDNSVDYIRTFFSDVSIVKVENKSISYGLNKGIDQAFRLYRNLDYIALLNDDLIFEDTSWLSKLIAIGKSKKDIGALTCRLTAPDGSVQYGGTDEGLLSSKTAKDYKTSHTSRYVDQAGGAMFIIKRGVLEKIGGFDEAYRPSTWEDLDLFARIRKAGYKIHYSGNCHVVHLENYSTKL